MKSVIEWIVEAGMHVFGIMFMIMGIAAATFFSAA